MSVINQMLKDLDQRQVNEVAVDEKNIVISSGDSSKKLLLLSILFIIIINIAGIFAWHLYTENQSLKASQLTFEQRQFSKELVEEFQKKIALTNTSAQAEPNGDKPVVPLAEAKVITSKETAIGTPINKVAPFTAQKSSTTVVAEQVSAAKFSKKLDNTATAKQEVAEKRSATKLSISRVQLTPQQLVQQKLTKAEKAIENNAIKSAEQLFEDILLIMPEHHSARKQLAALWFGRQSHQAALNLLSNGIVLAPNNSEYRIMQARIYLNLGQRENAVNTLLALASYRDVEYQALLASTAQQVSKYQVAIDAYRRLTELDLHRGRWWLGLAVAYDSNSQFDQAIVSYQKALTAGDLSGNAAKFSRERLQELGE